VNSGSNLDGTAGLRIVGKRVDDLAVAGAQLKNFPSGSPTDRSAAACRSARIDAARRRGRTVQATPSFANSIAIFAAIRAKRSSTRCGRARRQVQRQFEVPGEARSLHAARQSNVVCTPNGSTTISSFLPPRYQRIHHGYRGLAWRTMRFARGSFVGRCWSRVVERMRGTLILPRCEHWPPHGWIRIAIRCPWGDCHGHGPHSHSRTRF